MNVDGRTLQVHTRNTHTQKENKKNTRIVPNAAHNELLLSHSSEYWHSFVGKRVFFLSLKMQL